MGASILWRPLGAGVALSVGSRDKFIRALGLPCKLCELDVQFLLGLAAGEPDFQDAVAELIDAIKKHGYIEVFAEY